MFFEVLLEGASDAPVMREVLTRAFGLTEGEHFRLHPHRGRGTLPDTIAARPDPKRRGLLDRLPHKLRGYAYLPDDYCVLVVLDADRDDCTSLLTQLEAMLASLPGRPSNVLFRIAIEETESWFLADSGAIKAAYPKAKLKHLPKPPYDRPLGAWEALARILDRSVDTCSGADKYEWATEIAPHLNLADPPSASLRALSADETPTLIYQSVMKHGWHAIGR